MAHLINSKKPDVFRWHDSGDVQDLDHLNKIYEVCRLTPSKRHWLPTREAWIKDHVSRAPDNLVIRFSMPMIDQPAAGSWSQYFNGGYKRRNMPSPKQGNQCLDCRNCWNKEIKNISYGNIKMEFKHPKYYKELRTRNKLDQVISKQQATAFKQACTWSGPQATSILHARSNLRLRQIQAPHSRATAPPGSASRAG
jgi:hypothetical protein